MSNGKKDGRRVQVVQPDEPIPTEILAASIVRVSEAAKKLLDGGLTKRALIVLIKDYVGQQSGIGTRDIEAILDALPRLKGYYVKQ